MSAVDFKDAEPAWMQLFHIIREQYPYSKMKELEVRNGAVVSFKALQYTFVFARGVEAPRLLMPASFDEQWQRFMRFCQTLQNGNIGEVHFTDGRPVLVSMEQPGMDLTAKGFEQTRKGGAGSRVLVPA